MDTEDRWRLQLLDAPLLLGPADKVYQLGRMDAALFALLALVGPQPRHALANMLWPDAMDAGRSNLRQRIRYWRSQAGLELGDTRLLLRLAPGTGHDLQHLSDRLRTDPDAGKGRLLGQYHYADKPRFDCWLDETRQRLRAQRLAAMTDRALRLEENGEASEALVWAERIAVEEPLVEHLHRLVMRLHYLRGDRGAALEAYDRLRRSLKEELGVVPSLETLALGRLIASDRPPSATRLGGPTSSGAVAMSRPPRMVGREALWRAMDAHWTAGRSIVVSGQPGGGKSRLCQEFAEATGITLRVAGRQGDSKVPYATFARLLRSALNEAPDRALPGWARAELARVLPEMGTPPSGVLMPLRLIQAGLEVLRAVRSLWLDDLQFADDATLEALPALLSPPLRCLVCVRTEPLPPALAAWLAELAPGTVAQLRLEPLDLAGIEALLDSLELPLYGASRWAAPLLRHTGGVPYFVLETLRALAHGASAADPAEPLPFPAEVKRLIELRLRALPPDARRLARVAALAGPDFGVELAAAVMNRDPVDLADAFNALVASGHMIATRLAHDLVAEAVRASVPAEIGAMLHGDIARHLSPRTELSARVADHWECAGAWAKAAASHRLAAEAAMQASRRTEEAHRFERAADCCDRAGDAAGAFEARTELVRALLGIAASDRIRPVVDRVMRDAQTDTQRARAALCALNFSLMTGEPLAGETEGRLALTLARQQQDDALVADAAPLLAAALLEAGRLDETDSLFELAETAAARLGDRRRELKVVSLKGYVLDRAGRVMEGLSARERAARLATELGDYTEAITLTNNLAVSHGRLAGLTQGRLYAQEARELAQRLGHVDGVPFGAVMFQVGVFDVCAGHYRSGLAAMEAARFALDRAGANEYGEAARNHIAWFWLLLGQSARASATLSSLPSDLSTEPRARRLLLRQRMARFAGLDAGDWPALLPRESLEWAMQTNVDIELARRLPAAESAARCGEIADRCKRHDALSAWMHARLARVEGLLTADADRAVAEARLLLDDLTRRTPLDVYGPEAAWTCFKALTHSRATRAEARAALSAARRGIASSLDHIADEFRAGFLERNLVNAAILAALPAFDLPPVR